MQDRAQLAAVICGLFEIGMILVYFVCYGVMRNLYMSQILFSDPPYFVFMLFIVALQIGWFLFFAYGRDAVTFLMALGVGVTCAIGWVLLCAQYNAPDGRTSDIHKAGACIYMAGVFGCFVLMRLIDKRHHTWLAVGTLGLSVLSVVSAVIYMILFSNGISYGCIFEHLAFAFEAMTFTLFFSNNPSRPAEAKPAEATEEACLLLRETRIDRTVGSMP